MNTSRWLQVALAATASFFTVGALSPTTAATFDTQEVTASNFIAVAAPYGNNQHQLLIIEQISNKRPCWSESGSNPVTVDPLLLKFDFTGICGRSTDSNGYSIRMAGQDMGLDYLLRVVERDGDLVLVGSHRVNRAIPDIEIGRAKGMTEGFEKIVLNPGWRFTRRTYQGKALGHIYITSDSAIPPVTQPSTTTPAPLPTSPLPTSPRPTSLPTSPLPTSPRPAPLPASPLPVLPTPERELIFTKPQAGSTTPRGQTPATSPQNSTPPRPASTIPSFVVPTMPQSGSTAPRGGSPATSNQTLPSLPTPERQIPVLVTPKN